MRNTEQMVSVPRKWVENYADLLEERCAYEASERVQALLAQPAAQHQGEPVKTPARDESLGTAERDEYANGYRHGWNAYNDEIAKLGPLYTHPVPEAQKGEPVAALGESDVLAYMHSTTGKVVSRNSGVCAEGFNIALVDRAEVERLRADLESVKSSRDAFAQNAIDLRAQLAERDALLRDLVSMDIPRTAAAIERAKQILSASAEPNQCDGCQAGIPLVNGAHRMGKPGGYADTMSCQAGKYASAEPSASKCEDGGMCEGSSHKCDSCEPSAPVECDERADFERHVILATGRPIDSELKRHPVRHDEYECRTMQTRWNDWQARAALERKP